MGLPAIYNGIISVAPAGALEDIIFLKEVRAGLMALSVNPATIANLRKGKLLAKILHKLENYLLLFLFLSLSFNWLLFKVNWKYMRSCNNLADSPSHWGI